MRHTSKRRLGVLLVILAVAACMIVTMRGCGGGRVLVEQFDNGPAGGPSGSSEGIRWVDKDDLPNPGKHWKFVDPSTLTPEQRRELGLDELQGDKKQGG